MPEYPRKLILLSTDAEEEATLRAHLERAQAGKYELLRIKTLEALLKLDLPDTCHAILLNMRLSDEVALEAIHAISPTRGSVALLCLCQEHTQLLKHKESIHLSDDYLLSETLVEGELPTRISHAIRRRQKEVELVSRQRQLKALIDHIPDRIYFKDTDSRFTRVNAAMGTMEGGLSCAEHIGKTDADISPKAHAQAFFKDEQTIIRTGEPLVGKIEKSAQPNGGINWFSTTKLPLHGAHRQIIGTMGVSRDITEQQIIKAALVEERNWLRTILRSAPDRIFAKDREGRYVISNKVHREFLGAQNEKDVIGTTLTDHYNNETTQGYHEQDLQTIESGISAINVEETRSSLEHPTSFYLTSTVPLTDSKGDRVGLIGISRDITAQKQHEKQLRDTITVLNDTQLQLIEAEKLKTVGRLAAGIAHEIKNPLAVVSLGMDTLKEQLVDTEDLVEIVEDMQQATKKASSVIFELLDYSSPHPIEMIPTDVNAVIRQVLALVRHNLKSAHVKLLKEMSRNLPKVLLDTSKIEQVFINLFLNAVSVMKEGGTLTVCTYKQAGEDDHPDTLVLEIKDTGTGIAPADQAKLFEPFYSTKAKGEGTGLGLSVTRSIVEMHNGLVTLSNREDIQGACAKLTFPIPAPSCPDENARTPNSPTARPTN